MTQHTKGPWTYDRSSGYIGTDEGVIAKIQSSAGWAGIGKNIIASEQEENGRFIVRACNAHEELVQALKGLVSIGWNDGPLAKAYEKEVLAAERAIAKAEGKEA